MSLYLSPQERERYPALAGLFYLAKTEHEALVIVACIELLEALRE